ncbi:MAG TPA: pyridoxal phosphate-dependent aminotransferase [Spirochaetota bacterium]|jgi:aspartate aminotransferase|nr:pyridoxal phosphate-dependent aminotransferase [Spirochaetota bacterium]OQA99054.1 MAG: Aspartate aminotransferase [Spirochaetes bacterium ADurb.Bin218]HOK01784.1 pyridoxal phosphate-dependent aminotransferase [Spirochaetota bacterium]HON16398.1 pyridoxal phosphate-dependent aminotransferase [Spirochaetota bacterium]HOQ11814.1 pyridoxal phosphate-dependent aminotransferase [Spirochaetota bacterium]
MKFSDRIQRVKPSPTLAVTAMAAQLQSQGIDVIGFGSGEPDFDTPQNIKEAAIKAINSGKTKYTPSGGIPELKEAVVKKFKRDNNLEYQLSEVIINCGGKHSFYNLIQVIIDDGDEVIIPSPYWVSYPDMVLLAGGKPVFIETDISTGFKIKPQQLEQKITSKTKAVVINSPSNPTGAAYTRHELEELARVLEDKDLIIISDDIYETIVYDGFKFFNIANISEKIKEKTIVLNGVSKTYAMTGWRIGYAAGNSDIIKKMDILQGQSTSNPTTISQWAAVEALSGDQSVLDHMLVAFDRRRNFVVDGLNNIPGLKCYKPEGAFYAFPDCSEVYKLKGWSKVSEKYKDDYKSSSLCAYLMEEARTAVVPGIGFGNDNYFRISFATSDEKLKEGLKRIKEAIEKLV